MALAAGIVTSGKTGALSIKSKESGGSVVHLPNAGMNVVVARGDDLVPLVNNAAYNCNKVRGLALGTFDLAVPFMPGILGAALLTRMFGSVSGDTDAKNYFQATQRPDNAGSNPLNYDFLKWGRMTGGVQFSQSGAASAVALRLSGLILDPESGTATALTAPSSGPLSCGGIKGYAETEMTGASEVRAINWDITTGLAVTAGKRTGTNAKWPQLCKGLLYAGGIDGTVSVTQDQNAADVLGDDGTDDTLTLAFGEAGDGESFTFELMPLSTRKGFGVGVNMMTSTYRLKSVNGVTSPFRTADITA